MNDQLPQAASAATNPTCETCKYWGREYNKTCDKVDTVDEDTGKAFTIYASAWDDSGLIARLITGRNFSCIHHTPK